MKILQIFKKFIYLIKKIADSLENSNISIFYFFLTFLFITSLRTFVEIFSDKLEIHIYQFIHYFLSYFVLHLSIMLLFYLLTKEKIVKLLKLILPASIILLVAPIMDLVLSLGQGYDIAYILPGNYDNLFIKFITFFGNYSELGITPGIRIEIAIVLFASFFYFFIKTAKIYLSLIGVFLFYCLLFIFAILPIILKFVFTKINILYIYSDLLMVKTYLLMLFFLSLVIGYLLNKKVFLILLKDIRPYRVLHYIFMFVLGIIFSFNDEFRLNISNIFNFFFVPISIVCASMFSLMTNNIADIEIDEVSNRNRPLFNLNIDRKFYYKFAWLFFAMALIYALAANFKIFFLVLVFIGNYFLYSLKPLRVKRLLILSKLLIAINSLIFVVAGYITITNQSIYKFPKILIPFFLVGYTLTLSFIDIKDYEGDKKLGISTLPVVLGLKKAKKLIGIFFIMTYISVYFIINNIYALIPLTVFGISQYYLVNAKNYEEKYVFIVYLISLLFLFVYLIRF